MAVQSSTSAKIKAPVPQPVVVPVKKDKRQNSSRFNASNNRELQKLPSLKGNLICLLRVESWLLGRNAVSEPCWLLRDQVCVGLLFVFSGSVFPWFKGHLTFLN